MSTVTIIRSNGGPAFQAYTKNSVAQAPVLMTGGDTLVLDEAVATVLVNRGDAEESGGGGSGDFTLDD